MPIQQGKYALWAVPSSLEWNTNGDTNCTIYHESRTFCLVASISAQRTLNCPGQKKTAHCPYGSTWPDSQRAHPGTSGNLIKPTLGQNGHLCNNFTESRVICDDK